MNYIFIALIAAGIFKIVFDSIENIREGRYSLDYIAFLAMVVSFYTQEYLAGAVISLMFIGGEALEAYASGRAEKNLKKLSDTIPKVCLVKEGDDFKEFPIQKIIEGMVILVKKNEIVPLDGTVESPEALLNLSNLTGEVAPVAVQSGVFVKSGSVNIGETLELKVVGDFSSSTYHHISELVEDAKAHPARTVRISEKANIYFTFVTFGVCLLVYLLTEDVVRILAVLVVATPCPLIIAAPVAFVSGMSRSAKFGIILRRPSAFEGIAGASIMYFDKTGTLTLGVPILQNIKLTQEAISDELTQDKVLALAAGIEVHSLHPLAKAIVSSAQEQKNTFSVATNVHEKLGQGIEGEIGGELYRLSGIKDKNVGMALTLYKNSKELAYFYFTDVLQDGAKKVIEDLQQKNITVEVITGDTKENAEQVFKDVPIVIHANQSPEDKFNLIEQAKNAHKQVVMVGDGLNDAPALASASVGVVFSGTENGSSIESADVVILGHGIDKLETLFKISNRSVKIAKQSIYGGIGLSVVGIIFSAFGFIHPVVGAVLQEVVDVVVILNALRALGE